MGPSAEWVLSVCSTGSNPLNKMAAMRIYGKKNNNKKTTNKKQKKQKKTKQNKTKQNKTLKTLLLQNQESFEAESWYIAFGTHVYQVCSDNGPKLTFHLFTARSNSRFHGFV